jgi:hypothetical protein
MVLNLPLDECIDNTQDLVTKEKRKKETNKKKSQQAIESQRKTRRQDHLKRQVSDPLDKGNDSTHSRQNHAQEKIANRQTKARTPQKAPLNICKLPLSQSTLPLDQCSNATRKFNK